jgi:ribosomal protein S18 acetylase RimI-like enzyme
MTFPVSVVDAFAAARQADAISLVFEYMAATQAETGHPHPTDINQLPEVLRRECHNPVRVYRPPGTLLLAYRGQHPIGCVGLAPRPPAGTAEVKRLYVRPAHRGGIGRILMDHAHQHAAQRHFTRVVLDVLPTRTAVISFYRRLGYTDTEPHDAESPIPMIYMQRPITQK